MRQKDIHHLLRDRRVDIRVNKVGLHPVDNSTSNSGIKGDVDRSDSGRKIYQVEALDGWRVARFENQIAEVFHGTAFSLTTKRIFR